MPLGHTPIKNPGEGDKFDPLKNLQDKANQLSIGESMSQNPSSGFHTPETQIHRTQDPPLHDLASNNYGERVQQGQVLAVNKPQVPDFYQDDPKTWFLVVETEFRSFPSCSDNIKFSTVIKALDSGTLKQIHDILSNPPERNKYEAVKNAIIERLASSRQKDIRKLLKGMTLENRKPSQLLREMKDIAGTSIDNDILHQLWLDCLPADIRTLLIINDNENLETLAKVADRIMESRGSFVMSTTTSVDRIDPPNKTYKDLEKKIDDTQTMLATCIREIKNVKDRQEQLAQQLQQISSPPLQVIPPLQQQFAQIPQQFRGRSRSRSRRHNDQGVCYYHQRFGTEAKFCTMPCTYNKNTKTPGN